MTARRGFTLIELVIAMSLMMLPVIALTMLSTNLVSSQMRSADFSSRQGQAVVSLKSLTIDLEQASTIVLPASAGDSLAGCTNYDLAKGAGAAGVLDPARPATWFYYCEARGTLYSYHGDASGGCPTFPPPCGSGSGVAVASGVNHVLGSGGYFKNQGTSIGITYQIGSDQSQIVSTTLALHTAAP